MGAETSLPDGRTRLENDMTSSKNAPILFHSVHGDNIKLEKNRTVASRPEGFCKGIAFSNRPIKVREKVFIKFVDISSNWSGALRIGFTMNDPASMKSKLPLYACPNLTAIQGNWVKAIAERMAKKDSVLFYYVEENGDVHYGIDNVSHGVFFGGVNTKGKLWAVLDIYGNTISVEFLHRDSFTPIRSNNNSLSTSNRHINNSASNVIPADVEQICASNATFDHNDNLFWEPRIHGKNVRIEAYNQAYRKSGCKDQAYIFLNQSLKLGWRIALEVIEITPERIGSLVYGVTSCNPTDLKQSDLPKDSGDLVDRPEYWIVKYDSNSYYERDIIIYSIDRRGEVSVRKNKDKFVTFHVDPTQPMWLFFNMVGRVSGLGIITAICAEESQESAAAAIVKPMQNLRISEDEGNVLPGPSNQQSSSECVICCEDSVDCALYRCGHMCMCYTCASRMWQPGVKASCPICRKDILDVIKIYK